MKLIIAILLGGTLAVSSPGPFAKAIHAAKALPTILAQAERTVAR